MNAYLDARSVLLITLDSCRYDTFAAAAAPRMKAIGPLYRALAPSHFTFGSHASMFVGFTPGVPDVAIPYVNPKFGRIFKVGAAGSVGPHPPFISLEGSDIIDGFRRKGLATIGSGAAGWFDPDTETGAVLSRSFDEFWYPGNTYSLDAQIDWIQGRLPNIDRAAFVFLNVGETHVPYFYKGAAWDPSYNPCMPFGSNNDATECRRRQTSCLEYVDRQLAEFLGLFAAGTVIICSDHGDCWGEDGVWEHGVSHPKVLEVPLLFRLGGV